MIWGIGATSALRASRGLEVHNIRCGGYCVPIPCGFISLRSHEQAAQQGVRVYANHLGF